MFPSDSERPNNRHLLIQQPVRAWIWFVVGCVVMSFGSIALQNLRAQISPPKLLKEKDDEKVEPKTGLVRPSIQDALLLPYNFPFEEPTSLDDVCKHLKSSLDAHVVLDQAAMQRKSIKGSTTMMLKLEGVRLKTGLKLLLDQADLTYRVVPEDNLLVITDELGSEDPLDQMTREVKAIHQELHDLQNVVVELRDVIDPLPLEGNPKVENPTLKEPKPTDPPPKSKPHDSPGQRSRPGF